MIEVVRPALALIALFTLLTGVVLPIVCTEVAGAVAPGLAGGSLVRHDGRVVGSALIGQDFEAAGFFHGRPSATTGPDPKDASKTIAIPYDASSSGGSNLAPTSKALIDRVRGDVAKNGPAPVPGDMVTTSASGLDPDISPENAERQVARVAAARGLPPAEIEALVRSHVERPRLGVVGEAHVNVLALNLALPGVVSH